MTDSEKKQEIVLITGASTGIGYDLAERFARGGFKRLVLVSRNKEKLTAAAEKLRAGFGAEPFVIAKDLSRPGSAAQLFVELQLRDIQPDILINNAGVGMHGFFAEGEPERQLEMMQLNMVSLTELTRLCLPAMLKKRAGKILNVASTAAFQAGPLMAVYYASKAYVLSLSEALANELKGTGVTASVLCPGPTKSEFWSAAEIPGEMKLFKLSMMDSAPVADLGYRGLMSGKIILIPGFMNRFLQFGNRLVPRKWVTAIVRVIQSNGRGQH